MKTNWTRPGDGASLAVLLEAGHLAFPALCGPPKQGDEHKFTDLIITATGEWEVGDIDRIRNVTLYAGGL